MKFWIVACTLVTVQAHGYLKSPRSRNFLASPTQDAVWWPQLSSNPQVESCPHCLNLGGSRAACGLVGDRNYDTPKNALGDPMGTNIQSTFNQGDEIDIEVALTAHHKGHFSFYVCPASSSGAAPGNECFQRNPLVFVRDNLYGAAKDPNHPERAYIPPTEYVSLDSNPGTSVSATIYSYRMKLPENVTGERVLLQWHYLTANSCIHDGYNEYDFPSDWPRLGYEDLSVCDSVPPDGNGVPEQFWNCAEVKINGGQTPSDAPITSTIEPSFAPDKSTPPTESSTSHPISGSTDSPTEGPTAHPISGSTESPAASSPTEGPVGSLVLSVSPRCGSSELEARGNCGSECSSNSDCATGQWCWAVHANFCGTKPFNYCTDLSQSSSELRCGTSELYARELCGSVCTSNLDCAEGEYCWPTHRNTCSCSGNSNRLL